MGFEITRKDGRSNAQVLIDHVGDAEPGTVFAYDELERILERSRSSVQGIVLNANHRLLKEKSRTLVNLRNRGYQLAHASEHTRIANGRRRKADVQLRKGLHVLKNVRWDEMDEESRKAHEGTLMVTQAIVSNQEALARRQDQVESAIDQLLRRVDSMER